MDYRELHDFHAVFIESSFSDYIIVALCVHSSWRSHGPKIGKLLICCFLIRDKLCRLEVYKFHYGSQMVSCLSKFHASMT